MVTFAAARFGGWIRAWIIATVLWAVVVAVWPYPYWQQNLTLQSVQSRHLRYIFDDLALAIDRAEGGRLEADVVDKAADTVLGTGGRTIAGFEALAKNPPTFVQRMKRVPFAAPENDMEVRYFVFPVGTTDKEIGAALATESSRRQISEWGRTEPPRLDLLMRDARDAPSDAEIFELKTTELLADYYRSAEQLPRERLQFQLGLLALWLAPSLMLYAVGSSVGWAAHGFRDTRAIHYIGSLLLAAMLLLIVLGTFSEVESRFQCSGEMSSPGSSRSITAYMRLIEYRWWVGLWNDSDGLLWVEIPNTTLDSFQIAEMGEQFHISEIREGQPRLKGNFSRLSRTLALDTSAGFFDGTCTTIN
jgi:hypothetical protein